MPGLCGRIRAGRCRPFPRLLERGWKSSRRGLKEEDFGCGAGRRRCRLRSAPVARGRRLRLSALWFFEAGSGVRLAAITEAGRGRRTCAGKRTCRTDRQRWRVFGRGGVGLMCAGTRGQKAPVPFPAAWWRVRLTEARRGLPGVSPRYAVGEIMAPTRTAAPAVPGTNSLAAGTGHAPKACPSSCPAPRPCRAGRRCR